MMNNLKWMVLAAVAMGAFPVAAQAQYFGGFGGGFGGYGSGWQSGYGQGMFPGYQARPPYFSQYPPVYYSHEIIRRPMGPSPFAYPSWYSPAQQAREAAEAEPAPAAVMIVNPFVKSKEISTEEKPISHPAPAAEEPATSLPVPTVLPFRVVNPFVVKK